jgi:hypothetical protein
MLSQQCHSHVESDGEYDAEGEYEGRNDFGLEVKNEFEADSDESTESTAMRSFDDCERSFAMQAIEQLARNQQTHQSLTNIVKIINECFSHYFPVGRTLPVTPSTLIKRTGMVLKGVTWFHFCYRCYAQFRSYYLYIHLPIYLSIY